MGVLSHSDNRQLRDTIRVTWAKNAPFAVVFLIDRPTPALTRESEANNDVVFLNAPYSGRAVRFGDKLIRWYQYASKLYPDVAWVGKCDDDVFIRTSELAKQIQKVWNPLLYFGWRHGSGNRPSSQTRVDEMMVIVGSEVITRLVPRRYCEDLSKCDRQKDLFDTNYGGTSLGMWLSVYPDISITTFNAHMILQKPNLARVPPGVVAINQLATSDAIIRASRLFPDGH